MQWRIVQRLVVIAVPGAAILTAWIVYQTINAASVRAQVIAEFRDRFVGADVSLGSASFRLLGGITFDNLTLFRRDDPSQTPILHVPSGIIFHDKEQLARGKFAIRKLKFDRPRFTVKQLPNGRWNVQGILGPVQPDMPIPIMEFDRGAIGFDLSGAGSMPSIHIEIRNVQGAILNHPLPILQVTCQGDAGIFGPLNIQTHWHRLHEWLDASVDISPIQIGPPLIREMTRFAPAILDHVESVSGTASLHCEFAYRPEEPEPLRHRAYFEIRNGDLVHRQLPFPIRSMDLSAEWRDGVISLQKLEAKASSSSIRARAELSKAGSNYLASALRSDPATAPSRLPELSWPEGGVKEILQVSNSVFESGKRPSPALTTFLGLVKRLEFVIEKFDVGPELFSRLPPVFQKVNQQFSPVGPLDVTWILDRPDGGWSAGVGIKCRGIVARYHEFPYPLDNVSGRIDWRSSSESPERFDIDLTAEAAERRPVTIRGHVQGDGADPSFQCEITADDVRLDEVILKSLPPKFESIARTFHPAGRCDARVQVSHAGGPGTARQDYHVSFHQSSMRYDGFPCTLDDVSGRLDIHVAAGQVGVKPESFFRFDEFRGRRDGGQVSFRGAARLDPAGTQIDLFLSGENVPLDGEMSAAFSRMKLKNVWEMFGASGKVNFRASVTHIDRNNGPSDFDIRVAPSGAALKPSFFPYQLEGVTGSFRITRGRVEVGELEGRHQGTLLKIKGGDIRLLEGGYFADMRGIELTPLPADVDFFRALPPAIQGFWQVLDPKGMLAIRVTQLVVDDPPSVPGPPSPPLIYWDGNLGFANAQLKLGIPWSQLDGVVACRGRYRGQLVEGIDGHVSLANGVILDQPLRNLHAKLMVEAASPQALKLRDINGEFYGGRVGGEGRVTVGSGLQYAIDLKAVDIDLEQFARRNSLSPNAQLMGKARAEVYLSGSGTTLNELEGGGAIHVPSGKMYNLPLVLDVLKLPALRAPDGTAFEEAHAEFRVHGSRVDVQRLDLIGRAITLAGHGEVNIDGTEANLDLYAVWGHIAQVLPPGLREIPGWLSKNLLRIRATGRIGGQLDFATEPVPAITQPVRRLLDSASGRQSANRN